MPSKEFACKSLYSETTTTSTVVVTNYHNNNNNSTASPIQNMVPREVDELVNEIKVNLRLKSNCGSAALENSSPTSASKSGPLNLGTAADAMFAQRIGPYGCCPNNDNNNSGFSGGSSSVFRAKTRPSSRTAPYFVPSKSGGDSGCYSCGSPRCFRSCVRQPRMKSDPYQLLQELLKEGGLIKEAVRRISTMPSETTPTVIKCYDYDKDDYESASAPGISLIGLEA